MEPIVEMILNLLRKIIIGRVAAALCEASASAGPSLAALSVLEEEGGRGWPRWPYLLYFNECYCTVHDADDELPVSVPLAADIACRSDPLAAPGRCWTFDSLIEV